jgi:hypothetical protein
MIQRRKLLLLPLLTAVVAAGWLTNLSSAHASSTGNVIYHGGPVMAGNMKAYVTFWEPSGSFVSPKFNSLIKRYFRDIGDSGLYANNQQYTQRMAVLPYTPNSQVPLWMPLPIHPFPSSRMPISSMKSCMR